MSVKFNRNEDDRIMSLQTNPGVFSYAYLTQPRPESDYKAGKYGTDFVIRDQETLKALKEYLKQAIDEGTEKEWGGKTPKKLSIPLKKGDDGSEVTKGAYVLKTSTTYKPNLWIRGENGRAHEAEEDEYDDLYSGMEGLVVVKLVPFNYNGNKGITCYLDAVCKTGEGTRLGGRGNYEVDFSLGSDFDDPDLDDDEEPDEEVKEAPKSNKGKSKESKAKPKSSSKKKDEDGPDIDSLIEESSDVEDEEETVDVDNLSVDDFINS